MKAKFLSSRRRMVMLALVLALTVSAFVTMPAAASVGWLCEDGCWAWDIDNGCTQEVTCCASDSGDWFCILW